ncbi:hypothetical protein EYF80_033697 [Liparis tanakae]|uniref:Uncharacterized protein n=1 Tax=Liparis tanakae TaxID=230148 RepID=A0A4Z2GRG4_9TELE|nr:hypothetical protein EYF80_033697 [Liparis tanakae]
MNDISDKSLSDLKADSRYDLPANVALNYEGIVDTSNDDVIGRVTAQHLFGPWDSRDISNPVGSLKIFSVLTGEAFGFSWNEARREDPGRLGSDSPNKEEDKQKLVSAAPLFILNVSAVEAESRYNTITL